MICLLTENFNNFPPPVRSTIEPPPVRSTIEQNDKVIGAYIISPP
jgi:hypothetical protein